MPRYEPVALADGDMLAVRPTHRARCYVAVRGGFAEAPVMGSCATDTLAHVGPAPWPWATGWPCNPASHQRGSRPELPPADLPTLGKTWCWTW